MNDPVSSQEANRAKLAQLVEQLRALTFPSSPISIDLAQFAASAFAAYLDGEHSTLDKAFGLTRGRGAPASATAAHLDIARKILGMQLAEKSWNDVYETAAKESWPVTDARELRRIYKAFEVKVMSEELSRRLSDSEIQPE